MGHTDDDGGRVRRTERETDSERRVRRTVSVAGSVIDQWWWWLLLILSKRIAVIPTITSCLIAKHHQMCII